MAYLHWRTRTRILWLRCALQKLFPLHGLRLGFQSGSRSLIITVPIFETDIRTQIWIRVRIRQCNQAITVQIKCLNQCVTQPLSRTLVISIRSSAGYLFIAGAISIPEPVFKPVAEPLDKGLIETSDRVFYDLETSGLGMY